MSEPHVWVVELLSPFSDKWVPCAEAALNKEDGRKALAYWRGNNPADRFRIAPYIRKENSR